jgi:hypothetical protein
MVLTGSISSSISKLGALQLSERMALSARAARREYEARKRWQSQLLTIQKLLKLAIGSLALPGFSFF